MVFAALAALTFTECGGDHEEKTHPQEYDGGSVAIDAASGTGATSGANGFAGKCCDAQPWGGCGDLPVAQCVCAKDPYCCKVAWDASCAIAVEGLSCGQCKASGAGGVVGGGGFGGFGDSGVSGGSGGAGALGGTGAAGSGGAPVCAPSTCPTFNAPPCCLSSSGPCGVQTNQATCVPDPCLQPGSACRVCLCGSCAAEIGKCTYYAGCNQIADCMLQSGCTGAGCYSLATCQGVIDQYGGPNGSERLVADSVASCATLKACSCP